MIKFVPARNSSFIVHLERFYSLPNDGRRELYVKVDYGRLGVFLTAGRYPPFEGDEAWFRVNGRRKGRFEWVEQVERPEPWVTKPAAAEFPSPDRSGPEQR